MFERFTESTLNVFLLADEEARRMKRDYVGTEHLLLALIGKNRGIAWTSLVEMGVTLREARAQAQLIAGCGEARFEGELAYSPASRKALEVARSLSFAFEDNHLHSEHVLLALMHNRHCVAFAVLTAMKIDMQKLLELVILNKGLADPALWDRLPSRRPSIDELLQKVASSWPGDARPGQETLHAQVEPPSQAPGLHGPPEATLTTSAPEQADAVSPSTPSVFVAQARQVQGRVPCPNCAELVMNGAHVCRFCSYGLSDDLFTSCRQCAERIRKSATKCRYCQGLVHW